MLTCWAIYLFASLTTFQRLEAIYPGSGVGRLRGGRSARIVTYKMSDKEHRVC